MNVCLKAALLAKNLTESDLAILAELPRAKVLAIVGGLLTATPTERANVTRVVGFGEAVLFPERRAEPAALEKILSESLLAREKLVVELIRIIHRGR